MAAEEEAKRLAKEAELKAEKVNDDQVGANEANDTSELEVQEAKEEIEE